jgi:predicted PolB exonuclease-like 3'-5' exonuclease
MATSGDVKYLLFDVESIADGDAIARTRYPGESISAEHAIRRFRQELVMASGRDFIPHTYQIPITIVVAKVRKDLSLIDIASLDEPHFRPHVMTERFWRGWDHYKAPTLVTFNGRGFDLPLLELSAYRYGLSVKDWYGSSDSPYKQPRNRYNIQSHLDLHEWLTNFGSTWFRGGLNLAAHYLSKPGKMDVQGDMVQDLYESKRLQEISDYCRCDVLDTYFVFLRYQLCIGRIDRGEERDLVAKAKAWIEEKSSEHPVYNRYLEQWSDWIDPFESVESQEGSRE